MEELVNRFVVANRACAHRGRIRKERRDRVKNSGSGHRPWSFFGVPPPAAVEAHVLKDHDAGLQINRRLRSKTSLASLATLYIA
jgi:hypothetical protein